MRVDGARGVAVGVSVQGIVSVTGYVDALSGVARIIVDGLAVRPAGTEFWQFAQRTKDATGTGVNRIRSPYVVGSFEGPDEGLPEFGLLGSGLVPADHL